MAHGVIMAVLDESVKWNFRAFWGNVCPITAVMRGVVGKAPVPRHRVLPMTGPRTPLLRHTFLRRANKGNFFHFFSQNTNAKRTFSPYIGYVVFNNYTKPGFAHKSLLLNKPDEEVAEYLQTQAK